MSQKPLIVYIDTETTGLNPQKFDLIQWAAIVEINGQEIVFNEYCKPTHYDNIQGTIDVHGITIEQLKTFQEPLQLIEKFEVWAKQFQRKLTICGYNVPFDISFLRKLFLSNNKIDVYNSIFDTESSIDVLGYARAVKAQLGIPNCKLSTLADHFKIQINAHEALSDIRATIQVFKEIKKILGDHEEGEVATQAPIQSDLPELPMLHVHSAYSLQDSCISVENWIKHAESIKAPAISFPDHNWSVSLYYAINSSKYKKSNDLTVIPSISLNIQEADSFFRLNAYATSNDGYYSLSKLTSLRDSIHRFDAGTDLNLITLETLNAHTNGLAFSSAGEDGLFGLLLKEPERAKEIAKSIPNLFVELTAVSLTHYYEKDMKLNRPYKESHFPSKDLMCEVNNLALSIAKELNLKTIITSASYYTAPNHKELQKVISSSFHKNKFFPHESRHHPTPSEAFTTIQAHIPAFSKQDYLTCYQNAMEIVEAAKSIKVSFDYTLPEIEIPGDIQRLTQDKNERLRYLLIRKIKQYGRWNSSPEYKERFNKEYKVIAENGTINFIPYFLMCADVGEYARSQKILQGLGRGSAGGCLISYYLKIIHIDPIKWNIPFERFLSQARINVQSFPDIDCDFGIRGPIIEYMKNKYKAGFAQAGTIQRYKVKAALKKIMNEVYGKNARDKEVMDICDLIPDSPQGADETGFFYGYTDKDGKYQPGVIETVTEVQNFIALYPKVGSLLKGMLSLPASIGRHASAIIISTFDLNQRTPTILMEDDEIEQELPVTQYDAVMCDKLGLIKLDILGVTTIGVVQEVMDKVKERHGIDLYEEDERGVALVYRLPEDPDVFMDACTKNTSSSFQFNTDLVKKFLPDFAPQSVYELSLVTALVRPGALDAPMEDTTATDYYLQVRMGKRPLKYIHEDLKPILEKTNGVMVFQETVMQILVELVGLTLEEADQVRGAISKKKREVILATFERSRKVLSERGWTDNQIQQLNDQILAFSSYSFNISHSLCYAHLGYITLYLKNKYKLEWWSSELDHSSEDKARKYLEELDIQVLPPTAKTPSQRFTIVGDKIQAPISSIKGIGEPTCLEICSHGSFLNLEDFIKRVNGTKMNVNHFKVLTDSGTMDDFLPMEKSIVEERLDLLKQYLAIKKSKKIYPEEELIKDDLARYFREKELFICFNRSIFTVPAIKTRLLKMEKGLLVDDQGNTYKTFSEKEVPFFTSFNKIEKRLQELEAKYPNPKDILPPPSFAKMSDQERKKKQNERVLYACGIFVSSEVRFGTSKKTGKPWSMLKIVLTDGQKSIEFVKWGAVQPLKARVNSLVIVSGYPCRGWKGDPQIISSEEEIKIEGKK